MNFSAINDWVFIRRDEQDKTFLGLEISERALTKKQTGVITHSVDNQKIGCKTCISHYRVEDYDIGGESYAVVRGGDLFALEDNGTYRPINGYVKIRKCVNDHFRDENDEIFLYRTDKAVEETTWVEIIDVADDCENISAEDIGGFCTAPESHDKLQRLGYTKDYFLHESLIEFITGEYE